MQIACCIDCNDCQLIFNRGIWLNLLSFSPSILAVIPGILNWLVIFFSPSTKILSVVLRLGNGHFQILSLYVIH